MIKTLNHWSKAHPFISLLPNPSRFIKIIAMYGNGKTKPLTQASKPQDHNSICFNVVVRSNGNISTKIYKTTEGSVVFHGPLLGPLWLRHKRKANHVHFHARDGNVA